MAYSPRQFDVLDAIKAFRAAQGISPTMREIQDLTNISTLSLISYYLGQLERAGMITRISHKARSIVVTHGGKTLAMRAKATRKLQTNAKRLDGRTMSVRANKDKAEAARKGKVKAEKTRTDLEARMQMVVDMAAEAEKAASTDPLHEHYRRARSLRGSRVG